jgi:hypothetical protein
MTRADTHDEDEDSGEYEYVKVRREPRRRWPKALKVVGTILALLAAPLLMIHPGLFCVALIPGLTLFVIARLAE